MISKLPIIKYFRFFHLIAASILSDSNRWTETGFLFYNEAERSPWAHSRFINKKPPSDVRMRKWLNKMSVFRSAQIGTGDQWSVNADNIWWVMTNILRSPTFFHLNNERIIHISVADQRCILICIPSELSSSPSITQEYMKYLMCCITYEFDRLARWVVGQCKN